MARLGSSAHHLRDRLGSGENSRREISSGANAETVAVHPRDAAQPAGFTDQCAPADHAASELRTLPAAIDPVSAQVAGPKIAIFRREGEYWLVGYHSHTFPLKHRTGLALICSLVRHPGREICAAEVGVKADAAANGTGSAGPARHGSDNSGPVLDATAKQSYRARLTQLREELEEAREFNHLERASNIEEEIEFITRELARALGLAGRDRKLGSEAERARKRVSLAIKEAIRVIARHDASLGRCLARSIRTGRFCSYVPDPENPLEWQL